jgi:hypothetical protein
MYGGAMRRIHRPMRVTVSKTRSIKQIDETVALHQPRKTGELHTGRQLLERLRATPDHLRVGEKDRQVGR